ncbi:gliding motility-associated ABC transporter ATP-binding subunit GldA [Robertkochia marina]|uniref:Gliding motility-associated ABC transporter ATP-binding subunit GldA n=1 Tax=Robertkochia marina TaxID=1227945 RepID=A0A4S3M1F3_9FLAO|nr:gliding motility-associated ABC transporter ATP-binding subunit GldA [Robertkochia marina]THD68912.1 gliding motility-associated ABC transporter ATP-binding subunit GldA [Robertkochia marina]TRZ44734.1 gliding motility-associated ABC transporter ATP-binding subunit GldA [Robertkochia marina]
MSIKTEHINKFYGTQQALNDVSIALNPGEITGFLGPNGAGKSTLMKILTTYLQADSGSATVNGYDVEGQAKEVQKSIGYLPENNPLYPEMYVREYLEFNANIYRCDRSRVQEVIELTGLTPEAHKKIKQLSKGYKQRVGLAAALIHDPEVLILDEPTTGLDPNQLLEIRTLIRNLGKKKTVLLSTHIMQEVEAMCDRVIMIKKGTIVADREIKSLKDDQEQIIEVEFDYRVEEVLLQQLPHVEKVKNLVGFVYHIHFNTTKDMRPAVFDFAHDNGLKTLQLNQKNKNLENLFRELTED